MSDEPLRSIPKWSFYCLNIQIRGFHQLYEIGNNIGIRDFTTWKQLDQHAHSYTNWASATREIFNICSFTIWFLELDDSVRVNRAWLYKDPKVLTL